jgi:hypothetical protein
MATNTYVALDKVTVTGSAAASVAFTGISGAYTDLQIVVDAVSTSGAGNTLSMVFNADASSAYSATRIQGNGTSATSARVTSDPTIAIIGDTNRTNVLISVQNYSNTTTYKTSLARYNNTSSGDPRTGAYVQLRSATSAVTSITFSIPGANITVGSTFSLYGIAASNVGAKATGGTVYTDSQYFYHVFDASGTFTPTQSITADCLVVAGGGGGAAGYYSGGGGAGGLLPFTSQSLTATGYTVTVGASGAGNTSVYGQGSNGTDSQFAALTLVKGGGGGGHWNNNSGGGTAGSNGGSGGGAGSNQNGTASGGTATSGQGSNGGTGYSAGAGASAGGGGGGSGATGGTGASFLGGTGGAGINTYSTWLSATGLGVSGYIAGGGGGGSQVTGGAGGSGGGGAGGGSSAAGTKAVIYTGSGGGGSGIDSANGGNGGSGLVIVRYAK